MDKIKLAVVYFSPTGTTKKVIDHFVKGIDGEIIGSTDLTNRKNIEKKQNSGFTDADLIIMGAPTYGGFLYKEFRNYIKSLDFQGKCVIAITLYGNASPMFATREMITIIAKGHGKLLGYGEFVGEHSYSSKDLPVAEGRPNQDDLQKAVMFGETVRNRLQNMEIQHLHTRVSVFDKFISFVADIKPIHTGKRIITIPYTDEEKCSCCFECVRICPKGCIDKGLATNKDECIVCMACVKKCQTGGRTAYPKNKVVKLALKFINKRKHESEFRCIR